MARLRFGHQRPLNRRCPDEKYQYVNNNRLTEYPGTPAWTPADTRDLLVAGVQARLDTCDLVVAGVRISISPKYLYLYLELSGSTVFFWGGGNFTSLSRSNLQDEPRCISLIIVRKRSCGKVMVSQECVKNSVHGGGRCTHPRPWEDTSPGQTPPPRPDTTPLARHQPTSQTPPLRPDVIPPGQTPPPARHYPLAIPPSGQTPLWADPPPPSRWRLQQTVCILLECILVTESF